jgi:hypothetical protein
VIASHKFDKYCATDHIISVVVIDGISIGCPCCGRHNCHLPLDSNRESFCPTHQWLNTQCAIVGCNSDIAKRGTDESKTCVCNDPEHQKIEQVHRQKGQAHFVLKERLLRQCVSHPEDAVAKDVGLDELEDVEEVEEVFSVDGTGCVVPDQLDAAGDVISDGGKHTGVKPPKKVHAQFGRKRGHNEQIFVAP